MLASLARLRALEQECDATEDDAIEEDVTEMRAEDLVDTLSSTDSTAAGASKTHTASREGDDEDTDEDNDDSGRAFSVT